MANQKLSQVQIDGVEYDIGLKSLELSTGLNGIQQVADGVADGLPFEGENPKAEDTKAALKETQPYGAVGDFSAAFGGKSSAQGKRSFTNGTNTIALGDDAHAEGARSVALGEQSHAEGLQTTAMGAAAHAEGFNTVAGASCSHAEGIKTHAVGYGSHAEGMDTSARGAFSSAAGIGTVAVADAQSVVGQYNVEDSNALFIVGGGGEASHSNALSVYPTHSKVGKALSGDQPCLRNIRFGTRSPNTAIAFKAEETRQSGAAYFSSLLPVEIAIYPWGDYHNTFYQTTLENCTGSICIEVENNNPENILQPLLSRYILESELKGPRIFLTEAPIDFTIDGSITGCAVEAYHTETPTLNYGIFNTSAISIEKNKIYIDFDKLKDHLALLNQEEHYKYIYFQFCNNPLDTLPKAETHSIGTALIANEGELYLQIEE